MLLLEDTIAHEGFEYCTLTTDRIKSRAKQAPVLTYDQFLQAYHDKATDLFRSVAVNALGDTTLVPVLQQWAQQRSPAALPRGVENINWFGSDHTPYQLAGVRALTFNGPIPRESVRHYHDMADTIDKVSPQLIDDSAAVIVDGVRALAADETLQAERRSPSETEKLFTRFGLEKRMKAMGLWAFGP